MKRKFENNRHINDLVTSLKNVIIDVNRFLTLDEATVISHAFRLAEARFCVRHHLILLSPFKISTIDASGNMIQLKEQKERAEKFIPHLYDIMDFANSQE